MKNDVPRLPELAFMDHQMRRDHIYLDIVHGEGQGFTNTQACTRKQPN
jgi:hypothetical protein